MLVPLFFELEGIFIFGETMIIIFLLNHYSGIKPPVHCPLMSVRIASYYLLGSSGSILLVVSLLNTLAILSYLVRKPGHSGRFQM